MRLWPSLTIFLLSCGTLVLVHVLSLAFSLYWIYPWLDIPVHMLGGATVAQGYQLASRHFSYALPHGIVPTVAFTFIAGAGVELIEYAINYNSSNDYALDTATDLLFDGVGGVIGYVLSRRISSIETV